MIEEIKATARGAAILNEWLGAGGIPVAAVLADKRATICIDCVYNQQGRWWEIVKNKLADTIREYVSVKKWLNLTTKHDPILGTCQVCQCNNPLQVWVPIEHVRGHTSDQMIQKFPANCWKKKGVNAMSTPAQTEYARKWYLRNKEKVLAASKLYSSKNRDKRLAATKRWQKRNPEKTREMNKAYRDKDPEYNRNRSLEWRNNNLDRARKASRKWFKEHPEYQTLRSLARWALKRKAVANLRGISTFVKRVKRNRWATCYYCQDQISSKRVHFDHIIPLSKGGSHSVENLCVSCATCNHSKFNHPLHQWKKHRQVFLSL